MSIFRVLKHLPDSKTMTRLYYKKYYPTLYKILYDQKRDGETE